MGDRGSHADRVTASVQRLAFRLIHGASATGVTPESAQQDPRFQDALRFSMRILGSNIAPGSVSDEFHTGELMKRKLVRDGRTDDALRVADCLRKLATKTVLKNRVGVLQLLYALAGPKPGSSSSSSAEPIFAAPLPRVDPPSRTLPAGASEIHLPDGTSLVLAPAGAAKKKLAAGKGDPGEDEGALLGPTAAKVVAEQKLATLRRYRDIESATAEVSEEALLRDLLFVMQGIDGRHIRFEPRAEAYVLDPSLALPRTVRDVAQRIAELGWLFRQVRDHLASSMALASRSSTVASAAAGGFAGSPARGVPQRAGLMAQGFSAAMQSELAEYYKLIAVLEAQA